MSLGDPEPTMTKMILYLGKYELRFDGNKVWIYNEAEGGEFDAHAFYQAVDRFYKENL